MGQKTNPSTYRLGFSKSWNNSWFCDTRLWPKQIKRVNDFNKNVLLLQEYFNLSLVRVDSLNYYSKLTVLVKFSKLLFLKNNFSKLFTKPFGLDKLLKLQNSWKSDHPKFHIFFTDLNLNFSKSFIFNKFYNSVKLNSSTLLRQIIFQLLDYRNVLVKVPKRFFRLFLRRLWSKRKVFKITGVKLIFAGRLVKTKSPKTQKIIYNFGRLNVKDFSYDCDYASLFFISKLGCCGIKLWLSFS